LLLTGGNDPYKRLKVALKADIDAEAWESMHATESRPFDNPETGKIAVKVINDYGDEVMKVFEARRCPTRGPPVIPGRRSRCSEKTTSLSRWVPRRSFGPAVLMASGGCSSTHASTMK